MRKAKNTTRFDRFRKLAPVVFLRVTSDKKVALFQITSQL